MGKRTLSIPKKELIFIALILVLFIGMILSDTEVKILVNYDEEMLRRGPYPLYLKERILSPFGHLSNVNCGQQAAKLIRQGTTHILLGHLSQDNNRPDIADRTVENELSSFVRSRDYLMGVAPVETTGGAVIF